MKGKVDDSENPDFDLESRTRTELVLIDNTIFLRTVTCVYMVLSIRLLYKITNTCNALRKRN